MRWRLRWRGRGSCVAARRRLVGRRGQRSGPLWRQWVISMFGENLQPGAPHAHFDFAVVAGGLLRSVIAQRVLVASFQSDALIGAFDGLLGELVQYVATGGVGVSRKDVGRRLLTVLALSCPTAGRRLLQCGATSTASMSPPTRPPGPKTIPTC